MYISIYIFIYVYVCMHTRMQTHACAGVPELTSLKTQPPAAAFNSGCSLPKEIAEAETFYGVNLFFHHDTFDPRLNLVRGACFGRAILSPNPQTLEA